jgi:hypothetical protein
MSRKVLSAETTRRVARLSRIVSASMGMICMVAVSDIGPPS